MSTAAPAEVQAAAEDQNSLGAILRARWAAFKAGDVGSVPVIVGIIAITLFFTSKTSIFFSAVFVLLIGEIDLSIGFVSGVCGVVLAEMQVPGSGHQFPGLIAIAFALA